MSLDQGKKGVVLADADTDTGMELGAALANKDIAGENQLTTVTLDAKPFRFRVAAVTGTAACFFMCHVSVSFPLGRNTVNADFSVILTVALMLLVMLATTHLEDLDLVVTALRKHSSLDCRTGNKRSTDFHGLALADHEHLVKSNFCANFCRYLFYFKFFASGNAILLASGFYDRVHVGLQRTIKK